MKTASVYNPWSAYGKTPETVRITRSKARCAGPAGVTFHAPGWRVMVFRDPAAAERKLASHPGFIEWRA